MTMDTEFIKNLFKMRYYGRKYHENNNPMRIAFKYSKCEPWSS